jgi:hypothetical protein
VLPSFLLLTCWAVLIFCVVISSSHSFCKLRLIYVDHVSWIYACLLVEQSWRIPSSVASANNWVHIFLLVVVPTLSWHLPYRIVFTISIYSQNCFSLCQNIPLAIILRARI